MTRFRPNNLRRRARVGVAMLPVAGMCLAATVLIDAVPPATEATEAAESADAAQPGASSESRAADRPDEPGRVEAIFDIPYAGEGGPTLDIHRPVGNAEDAPAVLVVHGGGWRYGSKRAMSGLSRALAQHGFVAFNAGYTLGSPAYPGIRQQPRELRAAVRWIRSHGEHHGADPRRLGVLGSSAGAHLGSLLATAGEGPLDSGARVQAAVAWSAPFALMRLQPRWAGGAVRSFAGCTGEACRERLVPGSPITHVSPDDPPMLIVNSRDEIVPLAQPRAMARRLRRAGVPRRVHVLEGERHGMDYARDALPATVRFLRRALAPGE